MKFKRTNLILILFLLGLFSLEFLQFSKNISFITINFRYSILILFYFSLFISSIFTLFEIKIKLKYLLIIFIIFIFSIYIFIRFDNDFFVFLLLLTISSLKLDFKRIIKIDVIFKVILLLLLIFCYKFGYTFENEFTRNGVYRNTFGFINPNSFGFYIMILYFEIIYLKEYSLFFKNILKIIFLSTIVIYIINFSGSRSCEICIILFTIFFIINYILNKFNKKINYKKIGLFLFLLFVLISYLISFKLNNSLVSSLNKTLSGRIYIQNYYLNKYSINLLGNSIDYSKYSIDNAYIRLILNYGIIGLIVFIIIFTLILKNINSNDYLGIIFITLLFYGLMEWFLIRFGINIFLLYFSSCLCKKVGDKNV